MAHIFAITNQKGGVGKTTSAISISFELSKLGKRTLLIDFDPQGNATSGVGVPRGTEEEGNDLFDVFLGSASVAPLIRKTDYDNLWIVPGCKDLIGIESQLGGKPGRELVLTSELKGLQSQFDYIIIDCPPSSGLLAVNALAASNFVMVPLQAEYYALEGLSALLETIKIVKATVNKELRLLGIFLTMFDGRTNLSTQVEAEMRQHFPVEAFITKIPRSVRLSECPSHGMPIGIYDGTSLAAKAYRDLTQEIVERVASTLATAGELETKKLAANEV